jgi:hypothetical protein
MPQYHKFIIPRAEIGIFIRIKFASSSQFKCDSNALIFSLIGCESSELREFYKMYLDMVSGCALQSPGRFDNKPSALVFYRNIYSLCGPELWGAPIKQVPVS